MAQLDPSYTWRPDPARQSRGARWRGMARLSLKQLRHRFLESLLILLGIALGVGVLTGMGAFLRFLVGLEDLMLGSQAELQAVVVRPRNFDTGSLWGDGAPAAVPLPPELINPAQLTSDDVLAARRDLTGAQYIAARSGIISSSPIVAVDGQPLQQSESGLGPPDTWELMLRFERITPDEMAFRGRTLLAGRMFTWDDYAEGRLVIILEEESVPALFPGRDPVEAVGRTVSITPGTTSQGSWQIVGVVAKQELNSWMMIPGGPVSRREAVAYAPHTAASDQPYTVREIFATPAPGVPPDQLASEIELFFAQRLGPDRVTVVNPAESFKELEQNQRTVVLTLMGLAALALVVAAINILNLFTARVIRRRRLMAMSAALGADRRILFALTILEALLLGAGGSLVGMLPAQGVVMVLRTLLLGDAAMMDPSIANMVATLGIGWPDALVGLATGAGVSLFFGLYPAYLSASVEVADGLRGE